ncbi:carbohydrate ABC transporter permease [Mycoplasmatota bacterium]|nr:carbohydrate ABC transporter permease [Mycoplasmatota bacterium]
MSKKSKIKLSKVIIILILSTVAFLQTFPFFLKIVDSLHNINFLPEYNVLYWWPQNFSPSNYPTAFERGDLLTGLINSVIHTVSFTVLSLIIAVIVGYVLGKLEFKGKKFVSILLLSTMMIPGEVLMIPNYLLVQQLGWTNRLAGIILPGIVNVFGIFLIKQYMNTIPNAVLESAEIDGANELTKIFKVVIPMSKPVIITYTILTFTSTWNEYLWPMIIIKDPNYFTLQLKMYQFYPQFGGAADGFIRYAGMIMITVPIIIMYILFQKYFLASSNVSGMK